MRYVFDLERSAKGLRLNRFLHDLVIPEKRKLFLENPEQAMKALTEEEKDLVRRRDWIGLWRAGMSIYVMVKLSGVTDTPLPEIGKQMKESGGS